MVTVTGSIRQAFLLLFLFHCFIDVIMEEVTVYTRISIGFPPYRCHDMPTLRE